MSATWSGFSEEDIKKLNSEHPKTEEDMSRQIIKAKRRVGPNLPKKSPRPLQEIVSDLPEDAKLNKQIDNNNRNVNTVSPPVDNNAPVNKTVDNNNSNSPTLVTLDMAKIEKKVIDLDEFQARQKRIEEQNRRRKELLAKALADRTKQTEEEARRLKEIQNEFKKLDALLSNDVAILRHQIEIASLDFMEAQKRYHKLEKEFLDAKLVLHQRLEKKEMLTEHLCAIIEKNEERKAEKLNELMHRLSVGDKKLIDTPVTNGIDAALNNITESAADNTQAEQVSEKESSNVVANSS